MEKKYPIRTCKYIVHHKKVGFIAPFVNLPIIDFSILLAAVSHTNLAIHNDASFRELLTKRGK